MELHVISNRWVIGGCHEKFLTIVLHSRNVHIHDTRIALIPLYYSSKWSLIKFVRALSKKLWCLMSMTTCALDQGAPKDDNNRIRCPTRIRLLPLRAGRMSELGFIIFSGAKTQWSGLDRKPINGSVEAVCTAESFIWRACFTELLFFFSGLAFFCGVQELKWFWNMFGKNVSIGIFVI